MSDPIIQFANVVNSPLPTIIPASMSPTVLNTLAQLTSTFKGYTTKDNSEAISTLGTPVYGTVIFGNISASPSPQDANGNTQNGANTYTGLDNKTYQFNPVQFDIAIITVVLNKNIVKTKIQGSDLGTIKEYISSGDYDITIEAQVHSTPNVAPKDFVANFRRMANAPISVPVQSWYLNQFGIDHVVIEECNMAQRRGEYASQYFSIRCTSDSPPETITP